MALTLAEAAFAKKRDLVRKMLADSVPVDSNEAPHHRTALHCAVMVNDLEMVNMLLAGGANADAADFVGDRPIHFAPQHKVRLPVLDRLLEHAPHLVNRAGAIGRTPLHVAVDLKCAEAIERLLAAGADPSIKDATGKIPIERAETAKIRKLLAKMRP
ncbi:MAG TPA: ankyrin repeat domain-containing protein [Kofleriaceae bacterium]|nr:ankyrin repeat domain-containing protein [Kofleriaceae bacterium]